MTNTPASGRAVFSDVEGTLINISFPRTYLEQARALGLVPLSNQIIAAVFALAAKPFSSKSRIGGIFRYLGIMNAMRGLDESINPPVMARVNPLLQAALKPEPVALIRGYESQGYAVILVSAAFEAGIQSFAGSLGWQGEGTRLIMENSRFTGKAEKPLSGEEKAVRVRTVAQTMHIDLSASVGFGDTVTDVPFLSLLGTAHVVDPDAELRVIAQQKGWVILDTAGH
jgi:phosphoserine phosphatase